eukprot:746096-Ditylum_brightwellii.AAC.1
MDLELVQSQHMYQLYMTYHTHTAIVPYASAFESHVSQQKVSQLLNTTHTKPSEYVPTHRWSTSPPAPDTNYVHDLTADIDFNKQFFPDSTGDTSNNDEFLYHNNFLSY